MKITTFVIINFCLAVSVFLSLMHISYADAGYTVNSSTGLSEFSRAQMQEFNHYSATVKNEFEAYKNIIEEEFGKYRKEIAQFWQDERVSGAKIWIEYSDDYKTRKIVDYEKGTIEIESVVDTNVTADQVDKKITDSLTDLAGETNKTAFARDRFAQNVEERLVAAIEDVKVSHSIAEVPVASEIITGKAFPDKETIAGSVSDLKKNGETTIKPAKSNAEKIVSFKIRIPDERMKRKALQYAENVEKYSLVRKLDPTLVFAIMQTESSFNPMARSYIPAYGLMQIVPGSAGRDAANALFGEYRLLAPSYLYDCENNIKVGTAYISVVMYKYLRKIKNSESRTYCAIAAYNTGTTNVARAFIDKARMSEAAPVINKMTPDEVYDRLINNLPHAETRSYLEKVKLRMQHYVKN